MMPLDIDTDIKFDLHSINNGHLKCTYRGIPLRKSPFDQCLYQMLINEVQPDLIIEIGTKEGGFSLYCADILDRIGKGTVHSIDQYFTVKDESIIYNPRIQLFDGGFRTYDTDQIYSYEKVMIIDDGHNTYAEVRDSINKFNQYVSVGSYFIIEDGVIDGLGLTGYDGGPIRAIKEFLSGEPKFVVDKKYTHMFGKNATFNVAGYLKRIEL